MDEITAFKSNSSVSVIALISVLSIEGPLSVCKFLGKVGRVAAIQRESDAAVVPLGFDGNAAMVSLSGKWPACNLSVISVIVFIVFPH